MASSEKRTSIGVSAAGSAPWRPRPGAATKKSSRWSSPPDVWTSMKPPAPGPVSGDSATNDMSTHATAASTALPPSRSTSAPACAVTGWPAATTPRMCGKVLALARDELRHVDVGEAGAALALAAAAHARLVVRWDARLARLVARCGPELRPVAVAGGDHRDPDLVLDLVVDHGPEDDVRLGVRRLGHGLGRLVDLPQGEVAPSGDRQQDRPRPLERRLEQRRLDRVRHGVHRAVLAAAHADPEQRLARLGHDRPNVGEVEVDQPGQGDQVGDALHALAQHVVGHAERLDHRGLLVEHREQARVRDHDQRVDLAGELLHALAGLLAAPLALEREWLGDDAHRQRADLA